MLRNLTRTADSGGSNHVPRPRFGFVMVTAWLFLLALLPMNEPLMYVISAERSREKSQEKESRRKSGKKLRGEKKFDEGKIVHKICRHLLGSVRQRDGHF